ncbi:B3 domain-containing transcription factor VRN1-like [Euphorbia lathyris]|uniref:B3 domain-containing transcription factor VRN1-like n=1 Tax=Euphorbia lathyris TaxID=212925 RepID=UPI003313FF41
MASCTRKNKAERPHFFKVILADSITQPKMRIPRKFAHIYGDDLSSAVMLTVPGGVKWRVEIVKTEGEIWLQNGWREFAAYYSVVEDYFLLFEYVRSNHEFSVIIFNKSGIEIDYPLILLSNERKRSNLDEQTLNQNDQIEGSQREKAHEPKAKAVHRASFSFQSENPSFRIVMQPSYVHTIPSSFARKYLRKNGDAILNVLDGRTWSIKYFSYINCGSEITRIKNSGWKKFAEDNGLGVGDVCIFELLLKYIDQTIFRVSISKHSNPCTSPGKKESCSKQPKLSSHGPKRGRVAGNCNPDDTRKKIKLQNSVRTLKQDSPKGQVEGSKTWTKHQSIGRPRSNLSSENPAFQSVMKSSNMVCRGQYYLRLPMNFVKNMEQGSHKVKLQFENKLWSVNLNIYPKVGRFGEGWVEFARENSLKVGDVCKFELIDAEILLIRVSISRIGVSSSN